MHLTGLVSRLVSGFVRVSAVLSVASLFGCAVSTDPTASDEGGGAAASALAGGCREICPKCKPGEVCPKIACFLECNGVTQCGTAKCHDGEYCCNESCGICAPFGSMCTTLFCEPAPKGHTCTETALCIIGYRWSSTACACLPDSPAKKPGSCTTDADCRLFSDYCTGCSCDALSSTEKDPTCSGPGVRCLVDPCGGRTAACISGSCSVN